MHKTAERLDLVHVTRDHPAISYPSDSVPSSNSIDWLSLGCTLHPRDYIFPQLQLTFNIVLHSFRVHRGVLIHLLIYN